MPSKSKSQQEFMGAELEWKRAGKKTRTRMTEEQLEDFASTKRKGLPQRVNKAKQAKGQEAKGREGKGNGKRS